MWSPTMIGRVVDAVSYDAVLALLDRCASQPGQWIPKAEVEEVCGVSPIQLRNELGAFSKKTKLRSSSERRSGRGVEEGAWRLLLPPQPTGSSVVGERARQD